MTDSTSPLGVAVIGAGYWGPNLVRNLAAFDDCDLRWVCDLSAERAQRVSRHTGARVTTRLEEVLDDLEVGAVAIATPAGTHHRIGMACLASGRHVLIEKPLAATVAEGEELVACAAERDLVVMLDHTYCYTPAVRKLRELVRGGAIGDVQYIDSVRINLGLVQPDIDVLWDLATHDLAILDFVLPETVAPLAVAAHGADPIGTGRACVGYMVMPLTGNAIAHIHVNWLSPTKIRTLVVGGSRRTVVWDDLNPTQRLSMYDRGVELNGGLGDGDRLKEALMVSYRVGDMIAPALPEAEALAGVVREFAAAISERRAPLTDGASGLRVLRVLEAASRSLADGGASVPLDGARWRGPDAAV